MLPVRCRGATPVRGMLRAGSVGTRVGACRAAARRTWRPRCAGRPPFSSTCASTVPHRIESTSEVSVKPLPSNCESQVPFFMDECVTTARKCQNRLTRECNQCLSILMLRPSPPSRARCFQALSLLSTLIGARLTDHFLRAALTYAVLQQETRSNPHRRWIRPVLDSNRRSRDLIPSLAAACRNSPSISSGARRVAARRRSRSRSCFRLPSPDRKALFFTAMGEPPDQDAALPAAVRIFRFRQDRHLDPSSSASPTEVQGGNYDRRACPDPRRSADP